MSAAQFVASQATRSFLSFLVGMLPVAVGDAPAGEDASPSPAGGPGGRPGWRVALSLWLGACPGRTRPALASRSASAPQPQLSAVRATPELGAPCPPPRLPGPGAHAAFLHPPLFLTVHRASGPAEAFVTCCLSSGTLRSCPNPRK